MSKRINFGSIGAILVLIALPLAGSPASVLAQETEEFRETFEAFAVAMGTSFLIPPGASTTLQINITRWTTEAEREALFNQLAEKGQEGLVEALRNQEETGWAQARGGAASRTRFPSQRLRYAWQIDRGEGKRRIVLGLDRPISLWEARNRPRWNDYDLTLIVMDVDEDGEGEGQLAMGAQLALNQETKELAIESFGMEPVRLNRVRRR